MAEVFPAISAIIPALKSGNRSSWDSLCDQFRAGLTSKTRYLIHSSKLQKKFSADDLVQETLLKAWNQHHLFRGKNTAQFAKWLLTILRNTFVDWCRANPGELTLATWFDFNDPCATPSTAFISLEQEADMHACIAMLDPKYRETLIMRHFEGLKFTEISARTGTNVNTVASNYRRGLMALTDLMSRQQNLELVAAKPDRPD